MKLDHTVHTAVYICIGHCLFLASGERRYIQRSYNMHLGDNEWRVVFHTGLKLAVVGSGMSFIGLQSELNQASDPPLTF